MHAPSLSGRGIACAMAVVAVAGTMALGAAGIANASPAARPDTNLSIGDSHETGSTYDVFCRLTNASTGVRRH